MADRTAIIEKIKALLEKTANGCTEAEMMAALDKVLRCRTPTQSTTKN
jgi:Protein of unknown function (DUF2786)